jgi:hypothetical protein
MVAPLGRRLADEDLAAFFLRLLGERTYVNGLLADYFGANADGCPRFTGAHFQRLGGGGDRPDVTNVLTAEDLVAVSLLSVDVPAALALELLGRHATAISSLLKLVPARADLWASGDVIEPGRPAAELYALLRRLPGCGPTTTSKLLSRKRPRLLPVRDSFIDAVAGLGREWWLPLRNALMQRPEIVLILEEFRDGRALNPAEVSVLRVLDIVLWMHERQLRRHGSEHHQPAEPYEGKPGG